ncbi:T9SS type A sorting domain-containing protein [Balneolaceae bacterium ANBcel3]|nr:T9SS type A sorting domain-containing protein [Balneolaceae bacterium ANBcel3]
MLRFFSKNRNTFLLFLFFYFSFQVQVFSQTPLKPDHRIASSLSESVPSPLNATGTIHIVAVMAEFQKEENRFTSGNGTFDLDFLKRDDIVIGPLPHDYDYFEAHLQFAKNYFETVSNGLLTIDYHLLEDVIQLDQPMSHYAPLGQDGNENYKLANLIRDAWTHAGTSSLPDDLSDLDPDRTMYIVFHAGSGRNIELMGTTLYKTPQDIPSVYIGTESLKRLLDDPDFQGIPLGNTPLTVTNSALLPQTQSRAGEDVTETEFVLELSINGLLVANIGSFLGLPDLFNTESGTSGIGRFGLMDGASIFSYMGLFPPEPSAWEKMYLGWLEPFDIALDSGSPIELPAVSLRKNHSVARHFISSDEYFLVENRHRNPSGEPLEVTIRRPDGTYSSHFIDPEDDRFDPLNSSDYDELLEPGVLVNVSSFDWSLPGGPDIPEDDPDSGRILNGGMLIWHIDESVIRSSIADNRVNANSDRRGVQLVEADGARDIGRAPSQGQDRFSNGHAFDFWWKGNDFTVITLSRDSITVYENRFGPDTQPSNHSNTGSPSYFEFYDFSENLPTSHFFARSVSGEYADPVDLPEPIIPDYTPHAHPLFPVSPLWMDTDDGKRLVITSADGFHIQSTGSQDSFTGFIPHVQPSQPMELNGQLIAGQLYDEEQTVASWMIQDNSLNQIWAFPGLPAGPGMVSYTHPNSLQVDLTDVVIALQNGTAEIGYLSEETQQSGSINGLSALLTDNRIRLSDDSFSQSLTQIPENTKRTYVGNVWFDSDSEGSFFILSDNSLLLLDQPGQSDRYELNSLLESEYPLSWPAFADWSGDQVLDVFATDEKGKYIHGKNRDGGLLDFFPLEAPQGRYFCAPPLFADINGDGHLNLIAAVRDSLTMTIHVYDRSMRPVDGFPLLAGSTGTHTTSPSQCTPLLLENEHLVSVAPAGEVRVWHLPELGAVQWGSVYGPQPGNKAGISTPDGSPVRSEFGLLNKTETYNWPNPAQDFTHIRFETSEPSVIDITVINQSGSTVFEAQTESGGRHPMEIQINTSSWGNGVYFARVRAQNGSVSEAKLIKIVVTH